MSILSFLKIFLLAFLNPYRNAISEGQKTSTRRFSMAKANSIGHLLPENEDTVNDISNNSGLARRMNWKTNPDIFGSVISLEEDENTS